MRFERRFLGCIDSSGDFCVGNPSFDLAEKSKPPLTGDSKVPSCGKH